MEISQIMEQIVSRCEFYNAQTVILFGSRAKGTHTARSDFDIAVKGVADIEGLRNALEEIPTLYKIDVVDLDTCRNELLMEDIAAYGRKVYEKV
ncbi:MAG: nucleotidyltransferase domain-containing protein [Lachnospiraceae bacterium]|nr:nucleotidyltransferase domain-containing protein [Lachnospiraceae bacterium]